MTHGVRNGLIAGILGIIFTMVLYFLSPKMMMTGPTRFVAFIIPIAAMIMAGLAEKKDNNGFLSYGSALKTTFSTVVIYAFLTGMFSWVLFNFIDSSLIELVREVQVETMERWADMMSDEEYERQLERMDNQNPLSIGYSLLGIMFYIIGGFIVSLIISLIIKKDEPYGA